MAPIITAGRASPKDLLQSITPDTYRQAYDSGMNLSLWLEHQLPSEEYNDGLDAFERLMWAADIPMRSRPEIGLWAPELRQIDTDEHVRCLVPEMMARFWRSAANGKSASTRAIYSSHDEIVGSSMRPYAYAMDGRWTARLAPPIRLSDIVALTTPISSDAYKAYYLTDDANETRMVRVAEGTNIPLSKLVGGDNTIRLRKYGRGIEATYEAIRRFRIDKIRLWIERLAIRNEMDKVSDAIKTVVDGDGNNNGAVNWRIKTDFDSTATGKTVTLKAWLAFKLKYFPDYQLTHVFGVEADILKLLLVNLGSSGATMPTYLADVSLSPGFANRLRDGVTYGVTPDVPTDALVAIDASAAIEHVFEIGSEISEMERFARKQTEILVMSIVEGFAVFDPGANKTLTFET